MLGSVTAPLPTAKAQQQDAEGAAELTRQVVTGSRIRRAQAEGPNPVTVLTREDIERSGLDSVGKILQELPGMTGQQQNTNVNNGGDGSVRLNLRGLGDLRTLVLLNGRRVVAGGGTDAVAGSVDLDTIPTNIVERIEILADGASPVYGADAVTGVVNIITLQDYDGVEVGAYYDQAFEGDADIYQLSFVTGLTTGRGNLTIGAQYTEQEALLGGDRPDWADVALVLCGEAADACAPFGPGNTFTSGSSRTPQGLFDVPAGNSLGLAPGPYTRDAETGQFRPFIFTGPNNDAYNFAPVNYIQTPNQRAQVWLQGRYDLFGDLSFFAEALVHSRQSAQQLAPVPYDSRFDPAASLPGGGQGVSALNFYNPFGVDITDVRRRISESARRFTEISDTWRFVGGLQGTVGRWEWEASFGWGQNDLINRSFGQLSGIRLQQALGPSGLDEAGKVVCGVPDANGRVVEPIPGCVPLNLFGGFADEPITQPQLDYAQIILNNGQQTQQKVLSAYITGDLFELPAGPLGLAAGIERREERGFFSNDSAQAIGEVTGLDVANTQGEYDVNEIYAELAIPILSGAPMADALELTVGGRYTDYADITETETFQGGIRWQPHPDLLLRATYSEVFRGPNIAELFLGESDRFGSAQDPCGNDPTPQQQANCAANGVPGGSYVQAENVIRGIGGGNSQLAPEAGDTTTIGIAYSPGWLGGFTVTLDYWSVDLQDAIGFVGADVQLQRCADTGEASWCDRIERLADGSISLVDLRTLNVAVERATGYDFEIEYVRRTAVGDWKAGLLGTYLENREKQLLPGEAPINGTGEVGASVSGAFPRWRGLLSVDWAMGPWAAAYQAQYIHEMIERVDPVGLFGAEGFFCQAGLEPCPNNNDVPARLFHDIQLSYAFDQGTRLSLLLENVTDENPPLIIGGGQGADQGTDNATYRLRGASWQLRLTHTFQ